MTEDELLTKIEAHLSASGEGPTAFGKRVLNDPNLVNDLRQGRSPSLRVARVIDRKSVV